MTIGCPVSTPRLPDSPLCGTLKRRLMGRAGRRQPGRRANGMPVETGAPRMARAAVAAFFALAGIAMGSWVARIPAVQARLALDSGALGLALLGISAGAVAAMPSSGWLIARWGSRRVV